MARVFVFDSDSGLLHDTGELLVRHGYVVSLFPTVGALLPRLAEQPDAVVCSRDLDGVDAWSLGRAVLARSPRSTVLLVSAKHEPVSHPLESTAPAPFPCRRADLLSALDAHLTTAPMRADGEDSRSRI
ncbi:MAG: hypothetical protein QM765_48680 [Myxococcales bacterium]